MYNPKIIKHPLRCETCEHHKLVGIVPDIDECDILDHTPTASDKKLIQQIGCASHSFAKKGDHAALDITGAECVEVSVRRDEKVLWVNTENGCVLRICQIKNICVDGNDAVLEKRLKELEDLNRLKGIDIESLGERNEHLEEMIELLQRELEELRQQQERERA